MNNFNLAHNKKNYRSIRNKIKKKRKKYFENCNLMFEQTKTKV